MKKVIMRSIDLLTTYMIAVALVILAMIGVGLFNSRNVTASGSETPLSRNIYMEIAADMKTAEPAPHFGRNIYGETFGSSYGLPTNPDGTVIFPDLQEAIGIDGTIGYIRTSDLNEGLPATPEEAVEYTKKLFEAIENGVTGRIIPLYDVDGRTVTGEFKISHFKWQ